MKAIRWIVLPLAIIVLRYGLGWNSSQLVGVLAGGVTLYFLYFVYTKFAKGGDK